MYRVSRGERVAVRSSQFETSSDGVNHAMTTEIKAWFFLAASFTLVICGLAMLGLLTRPMRWSERA
jgi:hypothetical protein